RREASREAGSGPARCSEARLPFEDAISRGGGTADAGVSEMDSGRTCAKWADGGCDRTAFSRGWQGAALAAGFGGPVRISLRNSGRSNNAGCDAGLSLARRRRNGRSALGHSESGGAAVEFGGAV